MNVLSAVQFCCNNIIVFPVNSDRQLRQCNFAGKRRGGKATVRSGINIKALQMNNPSTYSSNISTDTPLFEAPGATFDEYLEYMPRIFEAMFPDKHRSQRLNEEEWRIHMPPINFLILSAKPVIDMKLSCKSQSKDYPAWVPRDVTKVFELEIIKWKLEGLDEMVRPSHFSLEVKGAIYPERRPGQRSRLKGRLEMGVSFILPALLALAPEGVRNEIAESVLRRVAENMKKRVNRGLQADYYAFKREKLIHQFGMN